MISRNKIDGAEGWREYLIEALKEDLNSREAEIGAIRSSLRYRVGGWVLEAWPPSHRTLIIISRMFVAFLRLKRRSSVSRGTTSVNITEVKRVARFADIVIFGTNVPDIYKIENNVCFDDPAELIALLDIERPVGKLVMRVADQAVIRRMQRLRLNGWQIIWWPENSSNADKSPLAYYLAAHADECRGGAAL